MLFNLNTTIERSPLQRQLDADQLTWSRKLQLETEGAFSEREIEAFRMKGLFGEISTTSGQPLTISPAE